MFTVTPRPRTLTPALARALVREVLERLGLPEEQVQVETDRIMSLRASLRPHAD